MFMQTNYKEIFKREFKLNFMKLRVIFYKYYRYLISQNCQMLKNVHYFTINLSKYSVNFI